MSLQFKQMMSVLVQNSQVAAPLPECHTDNISTGISTLTPIDSKDKRGKRKLHNLDPQNLVSVTPGLSRATQEETHMETFDDDNPDLQEL